MKHTWQYRATIIYIVCFLTLCYHASGISNIIPIPYILILNELGIVLMVFDWYTSPIQYLKRHRKKEERMSKEIYGFMPDSPKKDTERWHEVNKFKNTNLPTVNKISNEKDK